jgi:murein tripeptide amidase MpaA
MEENEASVLFLGCHHAREWISVEVPYLLGKYLVENYASDARVKKLVDNCEIWIVPLVNPDGLEYSIHFYRYWRKNMRNNGDGTYGVDLNRNYGYRWGWDNLGSSPDPSAETYRGPAPFSEPEIQAVRDLFDRVNFQALVSYHNYSQVILYPWGYTETPSDKEDLLYEIGSNMSLLMEQVNGRLYEAKRAGAGFYLTNGDTTDWSFGEYGIPSYTIELPPNSRITGGFFNHESDIQPIFFENLPAALYLIEWCVQDYPGQGPDSLFPKKLQKRPFHIK